jgi:hypothetical protein
LKLGRYTTEEDLIEEYERGIVGQICLGMISISYRVQGAFMEILAKILTKEIFYIWFTDPLMMLEQRVKFDNTLRRIGSLIKDVERNSAKDIFRWKRGQESLIIFISTAQIDSFWEGPVREYVEEMRSSETRLKRKARLGVISHHQKSSSGVPDRFSFSKIGALRVISEMVMTKVLMNF